LKGAVYFKIEEKHDSTWNIVHRCADIVQRDLCAEHAWAKLLLSFGTPALCNVNQFYRFTTRQLPVFRPFDSLRT
jgi:hypothetical protein